MSKPSIVALIIFAAALWLLSGCALLNRVEEPGFVDDLAVPADNNAAERSLRHLVIQRKISGGTHSPRGTATAMTLASLFGTWRLQGINPLLACRQLLVSPQA